MDQDVAVHSTAAFGDGGEVSGVSAVRGQQEDSDLAAAVLAAQGGSEDAFRALYRAVQPGLLRYLRVLVGEDAEDVASEAWLQIAKGLASFRGDADGFRGWAATIARHRALDLLRWQRRRPVVDQPLEELVDPPGTEDTAGSAVAAVGTDAALALIARLPRDQAEAVLLRVVVGLDAATAARVLGKRPGAVRTAAHRGLRKLAEYLDHPGSPARTHPDRGRSPRPAKKVRRPE
jgi:RNA polymerase sigma-70 factor (ECF subfamily)